MYIYLSLLVALIGTWFFLTSETEPRRKEIGRLMLFGLLAFLLQIQSAPLLGIIRR